MRVPRARLSWMSVQPRGRPRPRPRPRHLYELAAALDVSEALGLITAEQLAATNGLARR